ncbi:MAG: hypothetical protein K8R25_02485 [Methanosarcinales archaeon]|nr:hypothetical protein [Methanosarcinales archaeon]
MKIEKKIKPIKFTITTLIILVFIGAVFVSAVAENNPNRKNQIISDETIRDPEFAINTLQDLYRKYNVNEKDITFTTNDMTYYLEGTTLDNDIIVISTKTGKPPEDFKESIDFNMVIYNRNLCTIWANGKDLSYKNLMRQKDILTDAYFKRFGKEIDNRYVGKSDNLKVSEDTKLVAYGFILLPNGVIEEYRGYCDQDLGGYKEAMNKTDKWLSTSDETTSDVKIFQSNQEWAILNTYTDHYTYPPYGDYSTTTKWYWDDVETDKNDDYFMLKSKFSIMPGNQQYDNYWNNNRGYIRHDWKYYEYPGTRDMADAQPYDESGEKTVSITLSGGSVSLTWPTVIPDYEFDEQSDYIKGVAKWKASINPASSTCGGSTLTVKPGSTMHCSQNEARSGDWIGLAYFKSKPKWMNCDGYHYGETYTPGYHGYSNCVKWIDSKYEG